MTINNAILVNESLRETRVAIVEHGRLQELHIERTSSRSLVGNIYKAKVTRLVPGMQAAFVDIGLDKNGFLHARDILRHDRAESRQNVPPIQTLLRDGQTIMVQVAKESIGDKGARLTMELSVPTRNLVLLPLGDGIGISNNIENPAERDRLKQRLTELVEAHQLKGGLIVRTLAASASDDELVKDMVFLKRLSSQIDTTMLNTAPVTKIHEDLPLSLRVVRDFMLPAVEQVLVDAGETYEKIQNFTQDFMPDSFHKIELYQGSQPLFDEYLIEEEIKIAMDRKVLLDSGGYLIIDQTEAMTTIDVNSGSYLGNEHADAYLKTNIEAASEIARQLRLRNSSGIIIVDFIDMLKADHKSQVLLALESACAADRVKIQITDISPLGLVEITRQRTRQNLEQLMCEPCEVCDGRGVVKTAQTVCYEILRELIREDRQFKARGYTIVASPSVIDLLLDEEAISLSNLQESIQRPINLQVDTLYYQQRYDIVLN